jgi:hypothetical protein
LDVLKS